MRKATRLAMGDHGVETARPRAAMYVRVSTDEQTTEQQKTQLRRLANERGLNVVRTYEDVASGGSSTRPGLLEMLDDAGTGEFGTVLFWSADRLTREGILAGLQYVARLEALGLRLISLQDTFLEDDSEIRDLLLSIVFWQAGYERSRISVRTKAGMERARAEGKRIGRPPVVFDEERMWRLLADGWSHRRIAAELGISASVVSHRKRAARLAAEGGTGAQEAQA